MHKHERHNMLIELVNSSQVATQEELREFLHSKGIDTTQATISRDIQEIPLTKKGGYYSYEPPKLGVGAAQHVLSIKSAPPNIVIIRTSYGWAQSTGAMIDKEKISGIAGTVSGSDTILIVVEDESELDKVKKRLFKFFGSDSFKNDSEFEH